MAAVGGHHELAFGLGLDAVLFHQLAQVCVGTADVPHGANAGNPQKWEECFFRSRFTHPNFGGRDRLLKGVDPVNYWRGQLARPSKSFNNKLLVPIGLTVQDLLSPVLKDSLARVPTAEGEF